LRGRIKTVLIPKDNEKDLEDIPDNVKKNLEIVPVSTLDEVLHRALASELTPIEWNPEEEAAVADQVKTPAEGADLPGVTTH